MGRVIWTEPALTDVQDLMRFVAKDSPTNARKLGTRLLQAPRRLQRAPRSGWEVPELGREDIREILVRPYRSIYAIQRDECVILAVVHGSRDLTNVLRSRDLDVT